MTSAGAETIAIIGASNDPHKYGNKAVRAYQRQGYRVFPINPNEEQIEGIAAFKTINDLPVRPHRVSLYVPPGVGLKLLPAIALKGCDELWINPGAESPELMAEAQRLGLNLIQACSILDLGLSPSQV